MSEQTQSQALRRWFAVGALVLVAWAIWMVLRPLRMPLAWAGILTFLLYPLQLSLKRRLRGSRTAAAAVITAMTPIAIFAPLALIGLAFAQQIRALSDAFQANPELLNLYSWLDPATHPRIAGMAAWTGARFNIAPADIGSHLSANVGTWATSLAKSSGTFFLGTAGLLLRFFLMLFILFFLLRDGSLWFERLSSLLPLTAKRREALFTRLGKVLRAVVYGCGLTAIVQGALVGIGFAITGLSGPVVFGVLATLLALLPFGGAAVVWVPGVLYLLVSGHIGLSIFLLAWGGMVSISDNFIRPVIISRYTPVPTLLVFLGVIGGVSAFGPIGFIIGPVILVLATELLHYAEGSLARSD
ncbi:MAG: AI-2E family transporter [Pseudomonadota bacterium]